MKFPEKHKLHQDGLTRALAAFQLIEDFLKLYIRYSFRLASVYINGRIPFHFDGSEYENAPLERLLTIFAKLNDNASLIRKLNSLREKRNYCAHRAIIDYSEGIDEDKKVEEMNQISWEAWQVFLELTTETDKLDKRIKSI